MINKYLKISILFIPLMGAALFSFNNCARHEPFNATSTDSASLASESVVPEKPGLPYALLSAEQTLASMMKVTNVTTISTAIKNEYNARYGALAAGNDLGMVNGPLMLGTTSLAGEVCNSLLIQEKAIEDTTARNFFGSIDFASGVSSITDAGFDASIRGMARSFWGRNETREELALIKGYKLEFTNALAEEDRVKAPSTSNLIVASCAVMLSSVEAISY